MTLRYERLTAAGLPVTGEEITEAGRLDGELITHATAYAAAAALEVADYAGLAFITQTIRAHAPGPFRSGQAIPLPVGPALEGASVTVTALCPSAVTGHEVTVSAGNYRLIAGRWPILQLLDVDLPSKLLLSETRLLIDYAAGFGATAASVPADLKQAVLAQMVRTFDRRGDDDFTRGAVSISAHAARIVARYRGVTV